MISRLADVHIEGHVTRLVSLMQGDYEREYWDDLPLRALRFPDVGLNPRSTDAEVWRLCQERELLLLTNNRSDEGPDSLEATIRAWNTPTYWPVFTSSDADLILDSTDYRARVTESLYDDLLRSDALRGTGRLFLP